MNTRPETAPASDQARMLARFWQAGSKFWSGRWGWVAWNLTIFLVLLVLAQLLVQYLLNQWTRDFFDALERRQAAALWSQTQVFALLAFASVALYAASVWGRMTAQRKWRESLTRQVIEYWLSKDHFRRLNHLTNGAENPEYRISEDIRVATDAPIDLALALLASVLTAMTFLGVLWNVGGAIDFDALGRTWRIPGYLVLGVLLYSGLFSAMMLIVGRPLIGIIEQKNQAEAEFRAAADAVRRNGQATDSDAAETAGRRTLWTAVHGVLIRWRDLCWRLVYMTLVSHTNALAAPVVGWLLCVPKFLAGDMSLGEVTQVAAAFVTVQTAFNWLVENYHRLADWRSSVNRVASLLIAIDGVAVSDLAAQPHAHSSNAPDRAFTLANGRSAGAAALAPTGDQSP